MPQDDHEPVRVSGEDGVDGHFLVLVWSTRPHTRACCRRCGAVSVGSRRRVPGARAAVLSVAVSRWWRVGVSIAVARHQ